MISKEKNKEYSEDLNSIHANMLILFKELKHSILEKTFQGDKDPKAWEFFAEIKRFITDTEAVGTARGLLVCNDFFPMIKPEQRLDLALAMANKASEMENIPEIKVDANLSKIYALKVICDSWETEKQVCDIYEQMSPELKQDFEIMWDVKYKDNKKNNNDGGPKANM